MDLSKREFYKKTCALYKCNNTGNCRREWASIHSWTPFREYCRLCKREGIEVDVKDHEIELDNYRCQSCDRFWQSIHDDKKSVQTCVCNESVSADGVQKRFCRHYYWECHNKGCCEAWESFNADRIFTQSCGECGSPGHIVALVRRRPKPKVPVKAGTDDKKKDEHGTHIADHCDMCQHLLKSGEPDGCIKARKVKCEDMRTTDGSTELKVTQLF